MAIEQEISELRESSRRLVRALGFLDGSMAFAGCSPLQCHCLIELALRGRLNVGELASLVEVDKSNASRALQELERDGLVEALPDPEDQRSKPMQLTQRGRERLTALHAQADGQVREALRLLGDDERRQVLQGVSLYERALHRAMALREITVRAIQKQDEAEMAQIIRSVMTEYGAVGCGFSIEDSEVDHMWEFYQQPRWSYFVAEKAGRVLGGAGIAPLADADPDICELKKMYVVGEGRGIGLGKLLLEHCVDAARQAGFRRCYLETLARMTQARHLYEKCGFQPVEASLGNTGHFGCDKWYLREL